MRIAKYFLTLLILAFGAYFASANAEHDEPAPAGHGVRVFLGYLLDYKPDSTQSEFVARKLTSFGVQASDQKMVIEYLLSLYVEIRADIEIGEARIFCGDLVKHLDGLELQPVFNAYLDYANATYARHSAIASSELSGLGYPDLIDRFDENAKTARPFGVRFDRSDDEDAKYFESERDKICK
mgnify:CR=1 FL=1